MLQGRLDIKYLLKVAFEKTNYEPFYYKTFNPFECGDLSSCGLFAAGINVYGESKNKGFKKSFRISVLSFILHPPQPAIMTFTLFTGASINCCSLSFGRLRNIDFMRRKSPSARTPEVPERVRYQKTKPNFIAFHSFSTIFSYKWSGYTSVYSMKSMFWTNKRLSLIVAWSSSVSISCF